VAALCPARFGAGNPADRGSTDQGKARFNLALCDTHQGLFKPLTQINYFLVTGEINRRDAGIPCYGNTIAPP
jgi:hypothetical protein